MSTDLNMTDSQLMTLVADFILEAQQMLDRDNQKIFDYIEDLNEVYNNRGEYLNISNNTFNTMFNTIYKFFLKDKFYYNHDGIPFYRQVIESLDCLSEDFKKEKRWELKVKEVTGWPSDEEKAEFINYYLENTNEITNLYEVRCLLEIAIFMNEEPLLRKIRNTFFNEEGEFINAI